MDSESVVTSHIQPKRAVISKIVAMFLFSCFCFSLVSFSHKYLTNACSNHINTNVPSYNQSYFNNSALNHNEYQRQVLVDQEKNAKAIYDFFIKQGWTAQAICGMLGNIQVESHFDPNIHEYGGGPGYGLVQWTPKSKLVDWAKARGLDYTKLDTQCKRIQWEVDNNVQYYSTKTYRMTFKQFTQSRETPTYLAKVFIVNYERPKVQNQPNRGKYAENWYKKFAGGGGNTGKTEDDKGQPGRWLGTVSGANRKDPDHGYAGIIGKPIDGLAISGGYRYRAHLLNGGWLDEVSGFDTTNSDTGFAGILGRKIDAIMIKGLRYQCHTDEGWYPTVSGYNTKNSKTGYAGKFGHAIDAVLIHGTTYQVHIMN